MAQHFQEMRHMKVNVKLVALCPKRDLLALAHAGDGALNVYRFSPSDAKNFFEVLLPPPDGATNVRSDPPPTAPVTSLSWAPDGKTLAVGYADGDIFLVDIETHYSRSATAQISPSLILDSTILDPTPVAADFTIENITGASSTTNRKRHAAAVVFMAWAVQQQPSSDPSPGSAYLHQQRDMHNLRELRAAARRQYDNAIGEFLPLPQRDGNLYGGDGGAGEDGLDDLDEDAEHDPAHPELSNPLSVTSSSGILLGGSPVPQRRIVVLVSADATGCITLAIDGIFHVTSLPMPALLPQPQLQQGQDQANPVNLWVSSAVMDVHLASLSVMMIHHPETQRQAQGTQHQEHLMVELNTEILWARRHEFAFFAHKCAVIRKLCLISASAIGAASKCWTSGIGVLASKLATFEDDVLRVKYGRQATLACAAASEFLNTLVNDSASPPLELWLSAGGKGQYLPEALLLREMKKSDKACADVERILEHRLLRCGRLLVAHTAELKGSMDADVPFGEYAPLGVPFASSRELATMRQYSLCQMDSSVTGDGEVDGASSRTNTVSRLLKTTEALCLKTEEVLNALRQARERLRLLLTWLRYKGASASGSANSQQQRAEADLPARRLRAEEARELLTMLEEAVQKQEGKVQATEAASVGRSGEVAYQGSDDEDDFGDTTPAYRRAEKAVAAAGGGGGASSATNVGSTGNSVGAAKAEATKKLEEDCNRLEDLLGVSVGRYFRSRGIESSTFSSSFPAPLNDDVASMVMFGHETPPSPLFDSSDQDLPWAAVVNEEIRRRSLFDQMERVVVVAGVVFRSPLNFALEKLNIVRYPSNKREMIICRNPQTPLGSPIVTSVAKIATSPRFSVTLNTSSSTSPNERASSSGPSSCAKVLTDGSDVGGTSSEGAHSSGGGSSNNTILWAIDIGKDSQSFKSDSSVLCLVRRHGGTFARLGTSALEDEALRFGLDPGFMLGDTVLDMQSNNRSLSTLKSPVASHLLSRRRPRVSESHYSIALLALDIPNSSSGDKHDCSCVTRVVSVSFYGAEPTESSMVPGTERVMVVLESTSSGQGANSSTTEAEQQNISNSTFHLATFDLREVKFEPVKVDDASRVACEGDIFEANIKDWLINVTPQRLSIAKPSSTVNEQRDTEDDGNDEDDEDDEDDDAPVKFRLISGEGSGDEAPLSVAANGCRGIACVVYPSFITLYNIEEEEDEDEEEEEDDDDKEDDEDDSNRSRDMQEENSENNMPSAVYISSEEKEETTVLEEKDGVEDDDSDENTGMLIDELAS